MLTCGGYSSWGRFSACIHSIHPWLCGTKDRSSISTTLSPLGRTSQLKLKSSCLPSLIHWQLLGKARPCLHLQGQSQPLVTRAMGTQRGSPNPLHTWGLSPALTPSWPRHWDQPLPHLPRSLPLSCMATRTWARPNPPTGSPER